MAEQPQTSATPNSTFRHRQIDYIIPNERVFQYNQSVGDTFFRSRLNMPQGVNSHYAQMIQKKFLNPLKEDALTQQQRVKQPDKKKEDAEQKRKLHKELAEMTTQEPVNINQQTAKSHQLSKIRRSAQQIIEAWGYHEDKKVARFEPRVRSKILVAAMVQRAVEQHKRDLEQQKAIESSTNEGKTLNGNHLRNVRHSETSEVSETSVDQQLEQHFLKEYLLKDVDPAHHYIVSYDKNPFERGIYGLAELDHQQAQNQMENWSPNKFAALKNLPLAQKQEQQLERVFEQAVKQFKKNLREKVKLDYKKQRLITSPKQVYSKHLARLGLLETDSDAISAESDEKLEKSMKLERLEILDNVIKNRKKGVQEKIKKMNRSPPELSEIDSLMESAYDSVKNIKWGQLPRGGLSVRNPHPSFDSLD